MNPPPAPPPLPPPLPAPRPDPGDLTPARSPAQTLRRLFLTLFLRGHSARGLKKSTTPKSVGQKLAWTLLAYGAAGCLALAFMRQSVFALSLYLHGMTLVFLGMFIASSAGEVLFNQSEADILLHRPVEPRALLWAKIGVLVQVSLWLALAFNLVGLFAGVFAPGGGWLYPAAHVVSTALEALFCTSLVVLVYQLCLRWFGREKLDALMTTSQMALAITVVAGGQIVPRLIQNSDTLKHLSADSWWVWLLPPAWFAGFDDALAGESSSAAWALAALGLIVTAAVLWFAFGKLADDYVAGLQALGETAAPRRARRTRRRWLDGLIAAPPLRWWLRDPVTRASFQLTLAYLVRDRDVKLRVYPGMAPVLVIPFVMLLQGHGLHHQAPDNGIFSGIGVAICGAYLGLIPVLALSMLQYSQHWQAADLFRATPVSGPGSLYHGARKAVLLFLALPMVGVFAVVAWLLGNGLPSLALLLPGLIALPLYSLAPGLLGQAVPLSQPIESAKAAGRGLIMIAMMLTAFALGGVATLAMYKGWLGWFLAIEVMVITGLYAVLRRRLDVAPWSSME